MAIPVKTLISRGQERTERARRALTPEQIRFAEWLAMPSKMRSPSKITELATEIGVTSATLHNWKKIPEVWDIRDAVLGDKGKELVPEAITVIEELLKSDNQRVASDTARDILNRWGEAERHTHILTTLKDLYQNYQE